MSSTVQVHAAYPDTLPVRTSRAAPSQAAAAAARAGTGKSSNTIRAYQSAWRTFCTWAEANGHDPLPATPGLVAEYVESRALLGRSAGSLRLDVVAIATAHEDARRAARAVGSDHTAFADPTNDEDVRHVLRAHARTARRERPARQAAPLTREAISAIEATAYRVRTSKDGRTEHPEAARYRGEQDVALCRVLRDAALRREECSRLTWKDVRFLKDGGGTVSIQGRKTAQDEVFTAGLSPGTVRALKKLIPPAAKRRDMDISDRPVFLSSRVDYRTGRARMRSLSPASISNRVRAAALHAGLENWKEFSGHSGRVGHVGLMMQKGASLPEIQQTGGWRDPSMVAYYGRHEIAADLAGKYLFDE